MLVQQLIYHHLLEFCHSKVYNSVIYFRKILQAIFQYSELQEEETVSPFLHRKHLKFQQSSQPLLLQLPHQKYATQISYSNIPGTLADLKKQRSQIRTNGSPVENSLTSTNNHSLNSIPDVAKEMPVQLNPLTLSPSSGKVPRFTGNTSDVVGDTRSSHRCCIIMQNFLMTVKVAS